ncbi:hypothetical protein KQY27_04110 [Methanobrevibacter sp. TMH8]|uniref:Mur ligase family protein n=1 Tax=Methanobrevibacter sp. TMH8 TaxID=2848611 RepID=UPI001CCEF155|nr:hypothetical protein [Methanobrevibacter sp. TMH8]
MISGKKVLIVGAGNAGRPVANLFNYLGNDVIVTDSNTFEMLPKKTQNKIKNLKEKGITFDLGDHNYDLLNSVDAIYISPNIPKTVDFIKKIYELASDGKFDIIENSDVGKILNSLIAIPMIGIAGTDGKTTTTNMVNYALEDKFDTIIFSSLQNSLVIEGLVEMVVNSQFKNKELAVLELPHGTIRMAEGLELDACIITNLTPDHMDEFNTYEDYIERNIAIEKLLKDNGLVLANGDDPIISSRLNTFTHDSIVYGLKDPHKIDFEGKEYYNEDVDYDIFAYDIVLNGLDGSSYKIKSNELPTSVCSNCGETSCNCGNYSRKTIPKFEREVNIKVPGMINVENSLATILSSLIMGIDLEDAINRMANFNGVKGRFEKIDNFNNINIFMDAAHNPESMEKLFDGLDVSGRLILSLDNPDTLTSRDKTKIGEVLGKFIDVLIVSSKNETTEVIDYDAAYEIVDGAFSSHGEIESYITETVYESISYALAIADEEDTILHIGPGVVNAYDSVKNDIIDAIKFYKAISGKVAVIGGCGTVGSLMARVLACNNVDVTISDSAKDTPLMKVFKDEDIKLDLGKGHDEKLLNDVSSFFLAPSLMKNDKLKDKLKKANSDINVPILGIDEIFRSFKSNKNVFGITGTNGKTTTREILKNIFRVSGLKVPEHHLDMQGNTEFIPALQSKLDGDVAVIEIGTFGNKGEIEDISKNAEVDTGIITNISQDHLSNGSFEDYINCKKEIVDVADNLILCGDDPIVSYFGYLKDDEDLLFFGIADDDEFLENNELSSNFKESRICPKCGKELSYDNYYLGHLGKFYCDCDFKNPELDVVAKNIHFNQDGSLQYDLVIYENEGKVTLENGSIANVYNSLAAASGAWLSGIDFKYIIEGINSFKGVDGRLQIINENPKIILDYAHNPAGVKSIIQTLTTLIKNSKSNSKSTNKFNNKIDNEFTNRNENKLDNKLNNENENKNEGNDSKKDYYDKLIIVNTISSESGEEGDLEIAKLLSNADIVIPASHAAYDSAKFINNLNCEVKNIQSSKQGTKVGTLGANFEQVKEALKLAISIASFNDVILIIGEGGLKYSLKILNEVNFDNKGDI